MRIGITISLLLHAGLLLWATISIGGAKPLEQVSVPMQVDLLTVAELNDIRKGAQKSKIKEPTPDKAAKSEAPKPAEKPKKVAALEPPKPAEPPPPKPEPPKPEPPKPEPPKPEPPKPEPPKPEAKPEPPKPEPPKPDPIADALNKLPPDDPVPEPPKAEAKPEPKPAPKKPDKPTKVAETKPTEKAADKPKQKPKPKASLAQLQKALLDKQPNADAAPKTEGSGDSKQLFDEAFGAEQASGTKLSATEAAMLAGKFRGQVTPCWTLASGGINAEKTVVRLSVTMNQDGTVQGNPRVLNNDGSPMFALAAENAVRAVMECQPYDMPADLFQYWSAITINFDPKDMFGTQ